MSDKMEYVRIAAAIVLPNAGGVIGSMFAAKDRNVEGWYDSLQKPWWTPPKWVFGPSWPLLYTSMGYASYLVWKDGGKGEDGVIHSWQVQNMLIVNYCSHR